jgi:hypothetical protein
VALFYKDFEFYLSTAVSIVGYTERDPARTVEYGYRSLGFNKGKYHFHRRKMRAVKTLAFLVRPDLEEELQAFIVAP